LSGIAAAAALALAASSAMATFYSSEASFVAAIQPVRYVEDFSNFTFGSPLDGTQLTWPAPGANGFGWTASAAQGLYSNNSALSTNVAFDPLTLTFTGNPVTAVGGNITNTDITGAIIPGTILITLSDGTSTSVTNGTAGSFWGYTSDTNVPIASISFVTQNNGTNGWPQVDHFYSAQVAGGVPEPATLGLAAMSLGALAIRRRRSH
jgi:hypothetical protein